MVTSNTESGITVAYDDADNTLDFTVGTLNQDTTGNAATATILETARTIGGTSFDGSANIAVGLAATATALATARTIGGTSFDGTANIAVGLAATATALATARTIHGVSFDGTANIDLSEPIADTIGAMVSSNTETGIAVTYDDSDNTLDFVIGAGTIVNSMLADDAVGADELAADAVVNASVAAGAAIVDTKLATIATANKVSLTAVDIDGGTDIGADLTTSDLIVVDDGAGGTNRKGVTSADVIYTVAGSTTTVLLGIMIGNTTTSQITVTVSLASDTGNRAGANNEANQTVELVTNAPVPVGGTLELLAGNKVVMEATDALSLTASAAADIILSVMEIT